MVRRQKTTDHDIIVERLTECLSGVKEGEVVLRETLNALATDARGVIRSDLVRKAIKAQETQQRVFRTERGYGYRLAATSRDHFDGYQRRMQSVGQRARMAQEALEAAPADHFKSNAEVHARFESIQRAQAIRTEAKTATDRIRNLHKFNPSTAASTVYPATQPKKPEPKPNGGGKTDPDNKE